MGKVTPFLSGRTNERHGNRHIKNPRGECPCTVNAGPGDSAWLLERSAATALTVTASAKRSQSDTARIAAGSPNDWLTYHGTYNGWHYSPLDQINASNVKDLKVAWMHMPGARRAACSRCRWSPTACSTTPAPTAGCSRWMARPAQVMWSYFPEARRRCWSPRRRTRPTTAASRSATASVYVGTVDGRLIALDMKTGKPAWDTKLINSQKLTVGFTGAPLFVKDKVIIGAQGGEWPCRGPIFGVDAKTGKKKWEFLTVAGTDEAKKTWGNDSWRTGGGGGWMPGTYDAETNTVWWGTANPAPLYDWAGADWKTDRRAARATTSTPRSVIALDPDTGKLKFYHQELPHDAWDFDSAVGEFVLIDRDGKKYIVHPNKGGLHLRLRPRIARSRTSSRSSRTSTSSRHRSEDRRVDRPARLQPRASRPNPVPGDRRRHQLELGHLQPADRPLLQDRQRMVHGPRVMKTTPVTEPQAQLNIGAELQAARLRRAARSTATSSARDPITGEKNGRSTFPEPPLASAAVDRRQSGVRAGRRGMVHAYNAKTGEELWNHSNGLGHHGGIISYAVGGKQYIAVVAGFGGMVSDDYAPTFGEPYKSMPRDDGVLVVYSLK